MSETNISQIKIILNGEDFSVEKDLSVIDLLQQLNIVTQRFVVVINDQIVPKSAYMTTQLELGDHCDIISPISGG